MRNFSWVHCDEISHEVGHEAVIWKTTDATNPNGDVNKSIDYIHNKTRAAYCDDELNEIPLDKVDFEKLNFSYEGLVHPVT